MAGSLKIVQSLGQTRKMKRMNSRRCGSSPASTQDDPCRSVVAGAVLAADLAVDACFDEAGRKCRTEQQVIQPEACIALPAIAHVVPEREHGLVRMQRTDCVRPALLHKRGERGA